VVQFYLFRDRPAARSHLWIVLCFALLAPLAASAQSAPSAIPYETPPAVWPQASLLEGKSPADKLSTMSTAGMPVPDPRQDLYDVLHYNLSLQIDPNYGWVAGTVVIIFMTQDQPVSEIVLDFVDEMNCSAINQTHPTGYHMTFTHQNDLIVAQPEAHFSKVIEIDLFAICLFTTGAPSTKK
jgi:hypothetical protein